MWGIFGKGDRSRIQNTGSDEALWLFRHLGREFFEIVKAILIPVPKGQGPVICLTACWDKCLILNSLTISMSRGFVVYRSLHLLRCLPWHLSQSDLLWPASKVVALSGDFFPVACKSTYHSVEIFRLGFRVWVSFKENFILCFCNPSVCYWIQQDCHAFINRNIITSKSRTGEGWGGIKSQSLSTFVVLCSFSQQVMITFQMGKAVFIERLHENLIFHNK